MRRWLPKGSFAQNVAMLSGGTALGQAVLVLSQPLITRLYTPAELGALAVFSSLMFIASVVISLRYEITIPLPKKDEDAAGLTVLSVLIAAKIALLTALGLIFATPHLSRWLEVSLPSWVWWLLPFGMVGMGVYQALSYWAVRRQEFKVLAGTRVMQSLLQVIVQAGLGFLKFGSFGLLMGDVLGRVGGSGRLASMMWTRDKPLFRKINPPVLKRLASEYRRFPLLSCAAGLLNMLSLQLPNLLLVKFYSQEVGGWFFQSQRIMGLPMAIVGNAVLQVYFARVAQLVHQNPQAVKPLFHHATRRLLTFAVPIGAVALLAPWLFAFIFGAEWRQAGVYTQSMSMATLTAFVSQPTSNLNTFGLNHWQLMWDAGRLLTTVAGLTVCYLLGTPAGTTILVFGALMALNNLLLYALNRLAVERVSKWGRTQEEQKLC